MIGDMLLMTKMITYMFLTHKKLSVINAKPYIFLKHCKWVLFHLDVLYENKWFVLLCPPRGKMIYEKLHIAIAALSQEDDVDAGSELNWVNMTKVN
jgi:hypothetical protein